jgi:hypothetical protein
VVLYKSLQPNSAGLLAPSSIPATVVDSIRAFIVIHPVSSKLIAWSHVGTYWFEVFAWRAKTLQGVITWYIMYELVASFTNEYLHITEEDVGIRCTRVAFINEMKQYAVNDVVRAYLLPPFCTYGYLLPKLLLDALGIL